ncbi:probable arabinosyltransferase ARAD1 isoform X1 [Magnolia sinica]|uniref:probable arabinosyltransferase ARAD1 isoform X1 n=1 Tax=Magnolia sinica TaxID=86752 RepID=UPI002658F7AD|nr:probable arabinosyltransferase ARAD1 isoform X1 [Magnolia sinica]
MNIRSSQKKDEKNIKITKMLSKPLATLLFLAIVLFFLYIFIEIVDLRSHFPSLTLTLPISSLCTSPPPLKIYMYDLPRRFNLGMLDRRSNRDRTPPSASNLPPWPRNWGLKKQHSIEYWMMASLLYEGKGNEERDAVRVNDPAVADAFFVPFFSSLSFNTHGHYMTDPETEVDRQLQVDLLEFLRNSKYYQLSEGRDHVIPMHHPNAFRFLRDLVNTSMLVVADFGRCPKNVSSLRKDVVTPYVHVVDSFLDDDTHDPFESRTTLLFFRGRTVRKDEGIVRSKLAKILVGQEDVHFEDSVATGKGIQASTQGMRSSKFCLHPAGDTPSSCRLFDAIVSHCVPVIVSDRIELPFEDEIDYHEFSLFFSVQEALEPDYMLGQLRRVPKERWIDMWKRLKNISHHYEFQYPPKKDDAVNMLWRQVRHKLPGAKLAVHRNRRMTIPEWWDRR